MKKWTWIALAALVGVLAAAALAVGPWARHVATNQAEARGLVLEVREISVGFFEADLRDVRVTLDGVDGVHATLAEVHVDVGLTSPRLRRAVVKGGEIVFKGSPDSLKTELADWRARRPQTEPTEETSPEERSLFGSDLNVVWKDSGFSVEDQVIRGFAFEKTAEKTRLGAHLLKLRTGAIQAEIAGAELEFAETLSLGSAKNIGASEVRVTYLAEPPASPQHEPAQRSEREAPKKGSESDENGGLGERMKSRPERVQKVRALLELLRTEVLPRLPPHVTVERLWLMAAEGEEEIHVGPSTLSAERSKTEFRASIKPKGEAKGTPLSASVVIPFAEEDVTLAISGGPVSLATLGIEEGAFGLSGVRETTVEGAVNAKLSPDARVLSFGGQAGIHGLTLDSRKLSDERVSFPQLFLQGDLEADVDGSRWVLREGEFTAGEARFLGSFDLSRNGDEVLVKAHAEAPLVSCQALLDSAPRGLLGQVEEMRLGGTFSLSTTVEASSAALQNMKVEFHFENGCRASAVPEALDPDQFREPFRRDVLGPGGFPMQAEFGPMSPSWVAYEEVSPHLEKALLVSEDGRFFRHDGIDDRAIESAIRDNTRAGKFLRGASTISMQLAKNLYLSRNKTLARKFKEAALTSLLEQSFSKKELLELYVNVVEFGPGIYGIRRAAEHYFSTEPSQLTRAQCFFLASILPMPSREHFTSAGELLPQRLTYMHRLLEIAAQRSYFTPEELAEALKERPVFGKPKTMPEPTDGGSNGLPDGSRTPEGGSSPDGSTAPDGGRALSNEPLSDKKSQAGTAPSEKTLPAPAPKTPLPEEETPRLRDTPPFEDTSP